ncbi:MAG: hypothetical protein N2D54_10820, partial [Chloroflexota bacterium]
MGSQVGGYPLPASKSLGWLKQLFLVTLFPLHFWAVIILLADVGWVAERTNAWDAVGYTAYILLVALVESIAAFIVFAALSSLLPRSWESNKRLAVMGYYALLLPLWGVINQLNFFPIDSFSSFVNDTLAV